MCASLATQALSTTDVDSKLGYGSSAKEGTSELACRQAEGGVEAAAGRQPPEGTAEAANAAAVDEIGTARAGTAVEP